MTKREVSCILVVCSLLFTICLSEWFQLECPKDWYNCKLPLPKNTLKRMMEFFYSGVTASVCRNKALLSKTASYGYCEEDAFCGLLLQNRISNHTKLHSMDDHVIMCDVYARSADNCYDVEYIAISEGRGLCSSSDTKCHETELCDNTNIGVYTCYCDPSNPQLLDVGDACVDKRYYKAVGHTDGQGQPTNHGFKAVHYAPQKGNFTEAMNYCQIKNGIIPNYMDTLVEKLVNIDRRGAPFYWLSFSDAQEEGVWVDLNSGEQVTITNFASTEPNGLLNEQCTVWSADFNNINDAPCHWKFSVLCVVQ